VTFPVRTALFVCCCSLAALANVPMLWDLYEFSRTNGTASYVVLMPFVALALVYRERDTIFRETSADWVYGVPLLTAGSAVTLASLIDISPAWGQLPARVAGLVTQWVGAFILFYGRGSARRALFPLVFLVFTIPIPAAWLAAAVQVLKNGSTEAVAFLFTITGTVYYREAYVFSLPGVSIEIADECSGIRSSIGLLLTGLMASHVFLDKAWTRTALILAVLPMAIVKNAIRIVALTLLSVHVDPEFLTGQLHHEGGFVFFLLALGLSAPILLLLRAMEVRRKPGRSFAVRPSMNVSKG
jgi:exosortase